jgi:hypothetical protein
MQIEQEAQATASTRQLARACNALEAVIPRFAELVRSAPDPGAPAVGSWTVADVAAHVSHVCAGEQMAAETLAPSPTGGLPEEDDIPGAAARFNAGNLDGDPERDLAVLATGIEQRGAKFLATMSTAHAGDKASWLAGTVVPAPALATHLLFEFLVHGFDIARAGGKRWRIDRSDAALAFSFFPLLFQSIKPALLASFVDQEAAAGVTACIDVRVRGGDRTFFVFDHGTLTLEDPSERTVDCHISADPAALLLSGFERVGVVQPALTGRVVAWGRKPWLAFKFNQWLRMP